MSGDTLLACSIWQKLFLVTKNNMKLKTIHHVDTSGKKVFLRADLNAPLDSQKHITDKSRLEAILPTIRFLLENNAKILVTSHL